MNALFNSSVLRVSSMEINLNYKKMSQMLLFLVSTDVLYLAFSVTEKYDNKHKEEITVGLCISLLT